MRRKSGAIKVEGKTRTAENRWQNWNTRSCSFVARGWQDRGMVPARHFARFVGEAVRMHRKARFLSQEALAEKAGLSSKMVSLIERFEKNPSINTVDQLARGLGLLPWQLLRDAEIMRERSLVKRRK